MKTDRSWFKLAAIIADNLPTVPSLDCPKCGQETIDFQYVGDKKVRRGFLCIWCTTCLHGIHLAGVRIPQQATVLSKEPVEAVKSRIPNFIGG